jgi:hypothetical protein
MVLTPLAVLRWMVCGHTGLPRGSNRLDAGIEWECSLSRTGHSPPSSLSPAASAPLPLCPWCLGESPSFSNSIPLTPDPGSYEPSYRSPRSDEPIERRLLKAQSSRKMIRSQALSTGPKDHSHIRKRGNCPGSKASEQPDITTASPPEAGTSVFIGVHQWLKKPSSSVSSVSSVVEISPFLPTHPDRHG